MLTFKRTSGNDADFQYLVDALDKDLAVRDGDDHEFYQQYNDSKDIPQAIVAYLRNIPVAIGAFKQVNENTVELKRMYVPPMFRRRDIATQLLTELENWAKELGFTEAILETGIQMPEAINLYKKCGYRIIDNYGPYEGVLTSVCFRKLLEPMEY